MIFKDDIIRKIKTDFGDKSIEAIDLLNKAIAKTDYLKTDRVIRCILFLSKGIIVDLNKYIEVATYDTRDVMLWAEYERFDDDKKIKRLRDFNKAFDDCTKDVNE
jgi:hypothetical protein